MVGGRRGVVGADGGGGGRSGGFEDVGRACVCGAGVWGVSVNVSDVGGGASVGVGGVVVVVVVVGWVMSVVGDQRRHSCSGFEIGP